jgi:subtilase family serine protease
MRKGPVAVLAVVIGVLAGAGSASALPHSNATGLSHRAVCGPVSTGFAHCNADVVTDRSGNPFNGAPKPGATSGPSGYWPSDLQSAYKLPTGTVSPGTGPTIAIVDAYNDPNAESDLAAYRTQFGLGDCSSGTGCFTKVNQTGGTSYPRGDGGWAEEISLDLDMASAVCPNCKILLVEASSSSFTNLSAAEDTAANLNATSISNSYGGSEFSSEASPTYDGHYNHPGHAITVSSGDNGYGVEFPAASEYVTAVGGTSLNRNTSVSRGWSETVWNGAGSGCSAYISKPSWQANVSPSCSRRTVADVAAVADPNTGVAVYDTYHKTGWMVFGGTSVASPIIAGVYALAGNTLGTNGTIAGSYPYSHTSSLFDVTSGSNGSCGGTYLCTGVTSYDGPTGLGTPNGLGAF